MKKLIFSSIIMLSILPLFAQQQGIFKDTRDGKEYKTVVIATQTWLAENLAFKPAEGVYWAYDNNQINIPKYGYLYNWETAKNVCPDGWFLPSDSDWTILVKALGGDSIAGGKLKAITDWKPDANGEATNQSGFNGLPAGCHGDMNDYYFRIGEDAYFWSSTRGGSEDASYRGLHFSNGAVARSTDGRAGGFSVRCLKIGK